MANKEQMNSVYGESVTANTAAIMNRVEINGTLVADSLNVTAIHNAALLKEVETIAPYHKAIVASAKSAVEAQKPIAMSLYRVGATKLYEKDGFKSVKEYVKSIGLCVSEAQISQYRTAGFVYSDKAAPDKLKSLSVSLLGALGKAINNEMFRKVLYAAVESGEFAEFSQSKCQEWIKANCNSNGDSDDGDDSNDTADTTGDTDAKGKGKSKSKNEDVVKIAGTMVFTNNVYGMNGVELDEEGLPKAMFINEWNDAFSALYDNKVEFVNVGNSKDASGRVVSRILYITENRAELHVFTEYTDRDRKRDREALDLKNKRNQAAIVKGIVLKLSHNEQLTIEEAKLAVDLGLVDTPDDEAEQVNSEET